MERHLIHRALDHNNIVFTHFLPSKILFIPVSVKYEDASYSSGCPHTAMIILSSIVVSDSLRSLRRNHVTTRASSWLVNAAQSLASFAKVQIFQLVRFVRITRQTPEMLNSRRVIRAASFVRITPQDVYSRLCIDLTCKSLALNASFVSGVNAPLEYHLIYLNFFFKKTFKGVIWCDFKFSFLFGVLQAVCA